MAEPVRRRGRRSRGGGVGRGTRGARGRRPGAQRGPARRSVEPVLVDLVSDSDEEILEVSTARHPVEAALPESPVPVAPLDSRDDSDSDSEGADARPAGAPPTLVRRRRRLLLDPGEAPAVPVYSEKVRPVPGRRAGGLGLGVFSQGLAGRRSRAPGVSADGGAEGA